MRAVLAQSHRLLPYSWFLPETVLGERTIIIKWFEITKKRRACVCVWETGFVIKEDFKRWYNERQLNFEWGY